MPQLFKNNAYGALASPIADSSTIIELVAGHGARFPQPTGGDYFLATLIELDANGAEIDWEIVKVTARSTDGLTVERGKEGTDARSWSSGARIEMRITSGSLSDLINVSQISKVDYDNRSQLRSGTYPDGSVAIVKGLGLFVFKTGTDEPDDDESCFVATGGAWLLESPSWDLVDAWNAPLINQLTTFIEDESTRFTQNLGKRIITGTILCTVSSVSQISSAAFSGTITGARQGDTVIVTPPGQLGTDSQNTGRLSFHAYVSANDQVTVVVCNSSAASASLSGSVSNNNWAVTVIKGN